MQFLNVCVVRRCRYDYNKLLIIRCLGVLIFFSSQAITEYKVDYSKCYTDSNKICYETITINQTLTAPIFVYYELTNFYSNHRDYVKSKIWKQLRGEIEVDDTNNSDCKTAVTMAEMFNNDSSKYFSHTGSPMNGTDWANPCGLIAKAFFNGNYIILKNNVRYLQN